MSFGVFKFQEEGQPDEGGEQPGPDQGQPDEQPSEPSGEGGGEEGEM